MVITRTINSDKRYYLDENTIINQESFLDTLSRFNDMKIQLYNAMYEKKYMDNGPLISKTYSAWMKEKFHTNDYYNSSVYTSASAVLSSQDELKSFYVQSRKQDLETRDEKIESVRHYLENKLKIKQAVLSYIKTKEWDTPYFGCRYKVEDGIMYMPGKKTCTVEEYEYRLDREIKYTKTRIALLTEARKRAAAKLEALEKYPPKRVIFGTKDKYREKDEEDIDKKVWKQEFHDARHASMSLPGRHTSKNCNFLVSRMPNGLTVKCMDGKETVFTDFKLSRYQEVWEGMLAAKKESRKSICYNFNLRKDEKGRRYIIVSVTLELENKECRECFVNGWVSMDINYDHVALTDVDKDGKRIGSTVIRFKVEDRISGQISEEIGRAIAKVGRYCTDRQKPLIMEDIDTSLAKSKMRYGNKKRNRRASLFAYRKITSDVENQSYKHGIFVKKIDPAYTSQIGKMKYMRQFGISIHEAASYVIGLKGMDLIDSLMPDEQMVNLLTAKTKEILKGSPDMKDIMSAWKKITKAFRGIPTHEFFRGIPYEAINNDTNKKKKRKTLKMLVDEMQLRASIPMSNT